MLLNPPNDVRTKSYGKRRFDKAAPKIQIKSFRKEHYRLKILNTLENY
jgi:hypothetical protein